MQIFRAVFNCSNSADREKNKTNYCFPSIIKNIGKEWKGEKSLAQIFRKDLTEIKLEKTRMKIMLFASSPSSFFFTKSSQYQIRKANTYSIPTIGDWIWTTSVGVLY